MSVSAAPPEPKEEFCLDDDVDPRSRYKKGFVLVGL